MSFFVTRLWIPVPSISPICTPCSEAILRTRGDERWRTRSSKDSTRPVAETGGADAGAAAGGGGATGGGAGAGAERAAARGLTSGFGAGDAAAAGGGGAASGFGAGAGAAGAGAAAAFSPASPISATTVLIATVWPSATLISRSVPAAGDGISASTLSVEISKIGSSRLTGSPTFLSHFVIVPSAIDSPICGMMTSAAMVLPFAVSSLGETGQMGK